MRAHCSQRRDPATVYDSNYTLDLPKHCGRGMSTYVISPRTERGFDIKIVGDDGARQTMLGFPTREAAEAWIMEDQRRSREEVQSSSPAPRRI